MDHSTEPAVPRDLQPRVLNPEERASVAAARRSFVGKQLDYLGLSLHYLELFDANPSAGLPYHGNEHQLALAAVLSRGARVEGLSEGNQRALLLAALFHDSDYEVGRSESENIASAVRFGRWALDQLNPELKDLVESLIRATEFPHGEALRLSERLIQDADLLMVSQPDFGNFLQGLREEGGYEPDPLFPGLESLSTGWGKNLYRLSLELHRFPDDLSYAPEERVALGGTHHAQTLTSRGFSVDRAMAPLIEALWVQGFETAFCCEGDSLRRSPGFADHIPGYIAFLELSDEQLARVETVARAVDREVEIFPHSRGGSAIVVRFWHHQIPQVTAILLDSDGVS